MILTSPENIRTERLKVIAFDLDGTLTQHRTPLDSRNRAVLEALSKKYRILMVGAGLCTRIFNQLCGFPVDILGNYGLQYAKYNREAENIDIIRDVVLPCDRDRAAKNVEILREEYGFTEFAGDGIEFHSSGAITFPILGTKAKIEDKLAFDPDRSRRRPMYDRVKELFPEYTVFIGGSSSFDFSGKKYNKYDAIMTYAAQHGYEKDEILYVGDDFGDGGGDSHVRLGGIDYVEILDYTTLEDKMKDY